MIRFKRRNLWWLVTLGLMVGVVIVGEASALLQALALALFVGALAMSFVDFPGLDLRRLWGKLQQLPIAQRATPNAREAVKRALRRGARPQPDLVLLDIGLIATRTDEDGITMRRIISANLDDDGIRPYLVLHVAPASADRYVHIRFEIYDQDDEERYIYTMKKYLQAGEVNIIADNHLPLHGNEDIQAVGDWEMRVYIDDALYSVETFTVTPSLQARQRRLARNGRHKRLLSLEDFLRQSRRQ